MKAEALKLQRTIALNEVRRARAGNDKQSMPDGQIAQKASKASGASVDQVLKWMREARV